MTERPGKVDVFTIPPQCAFSDSLARGLIQRFGTDPMGLARGRILLPSNRAVRSVTEAFVRESGQGLLLPRLIAIGDPDLDERIGGALDSVGGDDVPAAIDPAERLLWLGSIIARQGSGAAEAVRLGGELARTLDALLIEEVEPTRLAEAVQEGTQLADHWQRSLEKLQLIYREWPGILRERGLVDLTVRRNLVLDAVAKRWSDQPPTGFTVAAGISTAAPAIARLLGTVARMSGGEVVLPGLWLADLMPDEEWDALRPDGERGEPGHPQYHLRLLLDRMRVDRDSVRPWPVAAGACSSPRRALAVANAMASPEASTKWATLAGDQRDFRGITTAEFPDIAAEAQGIALALREALETPAKTAALVTPDRALATRVSALLKRWNIEADDSAGRPLSLTPPATLALACASLAAEEFAPVATLAVLKHPLVGGEGDERLQWLDLVRRLDSRLRGPRPAAGIAGLRRHFLDKKLGDAFARVEPMLAPLARLFDGAPSLSEFAARLTEAVQGLADDRAWRGPDGRMVAEMLSQWQSLPAAQAITVGPEDAVPLLRGLFDGQSVRPPYGGHPRIFIWGLLEARLQRTDLLILGGLDDGVWPSLPSPDPWLPPLIRRELDIPSTDGRIGLAAHDFAGALCAPEVLVTRAKRDSRSPTVPSRFWLRLKTLDPDRPSDPALPALVAALDRPDAVRPASRPEPAPPAADRPKRISVTAVDRLRADPYAFYAQKILGLTRWEPIDADATAAWKGSAVHDALEHWQKDDDCAPDRLQPRIELMLANEALHPLTRALWRPRLAEAIAWIAEQVEEDRSQGRVPQASEVDGETQVAGVTLHGKADRIDRLADGGVAIIDYKTGHPADKKAIAAGFALQLGLLGLIAQGGGFGGGMTEPRLFEYWSLAKGKDGFGYRVDAQQAMPEGKDFLATTSVLFAKAAGDWLTGTRGFKAKLNPAQSIYGDYDQLMRLEEWYARTR